MADSARRPLRWLVIAEMYPPQVEGIALSTWKFCRALADRGIELTVVTAQPKSDAPPWWADSRIRELRLPQLPPRLPRRLAGNLGRLYLGTYWGSWWGAVASRTADRLLQGGGFHKLVTRTEPASGIVVGRRLARRHGIDWIAAINDPHPACLYPPPYGPGRPSTWRERLQCRWVARALESSAAVVVPSRRLERLERNQGVFPQSLRTHVIPHCGLVIDAGAQAAATHAARSERAELLHVGMISSRNRGIQTLLDTIQELQRQDPELSRRFVVRLIGSVDDTTRQRVAQHGLQGSFVFDHQRPPRECAVAMQSTDALLLIEAPLEEGIFLPGKFSDYLCSRRPTLMFSPVNGTIADLVGGLRHPGFLTQDPATAARRLADFLRRRLSGDACIDFVLPPCCGVTPEEHADLWLEACASRAGGA